MDPLDLHYKISDVDNSGEPKYYGFLAPNGYWYIQREVASPNGFRYFFGQTGYAAAWADRANLAYDYFSVIF